VYFTTIIYKHAPVLSQSWQEHCEPRSLFDRVATMTLDRFIGTMILDIADVFNTNAAFIIPFVDLPTSPPAMWCEERIWNFSVLQRIHLPITVSILGSSVKLPSFYMFQNM
jgi:hypothetical protein